MLLPLFILFTDLNLVSTYQGVSPASTQGSRSRSRRSCLRTSSGAILNEADSNQPVTDGARQGRVLIRIVVPAVGVRRS